MQNGDLVVVDAAHATKPAISRYHNFCSKYRYRCFVVDFSNVTLETCKENNMKRDQWKIVPNSNIEKYFYSIRNKNETPPTWVSPIVFLIVTRNAG
jgi:predicted kinase